MYPSEKAIVLSPDRNKNTPIELNNANMETLALIVFSTFAARLNILMHQLALTAVTKILETGALSGASWSRIHICLHGQKFVNELLKYSRLNLWRQNLAMNGCVLKIRNASAPEKKYIHIYTLHWPLTESGTQMAIAVSFLNSPVEYDKTKH